MKPIDLRRRRPDFDSHPWVPLALVVLGLLILWFLGGCASDVPSIASDDPTDAAAADVLEGVDGVVDVGELEAHDAKLEAHVDVGELESTPSADAPVDAGVDTRPEDVAGEAPCVKRCIVAGGVPLGYFCGLPSDCCSGHCGGPEKKCLPPVDACAGCWSECP